MHTVALPAPTAISKIRRYEETKLSCRVHRRRPSGRQLATRESQIQTARDRTRLGSAILAFPDARSAWRWTPCPRPGWRGGRQPVACLRRFFDSSELRFFDGHRGPCQCDSEVRRDDLSCRMCTMIAATLLLTTMAVISGDQE